MNKLRILGGALLLTLLIIIATTVAYRAGVASATPRQSSLSNHDWALIYKTSLLGDISIVHELNKLLDEGDHEQAKMAALFVLQRLLEEAELLDRFAQGRAVASFPEVAAASAYIESLTSSDQDEGDLQANDINHHRVIVPPSKPHP